jgi:hypothetical protein
MAALFGGSGQWCGVCLKWWCGVAGAAGAAGVAAATGGRGKDGIHDKYYTK